MNQTDFLTVARAVSTLTSVPLYVRAYEKGIELYPDGDLLFTPGQFLSGQDFLSLMQYMDSGNYVYITDRAGVHWFLVRVGGYVVLGGPYMTEMTGRQESALLFQNLSGEKDSRHYFYEGENDRQRSFREYLMKMPLVFEHQLQKLISFLGDILCEKDLKPCDEYRMVQNDYTKFFQEDFDRYLSYQEDCEAGLVACVAHGIDHEIHQIMHVLYSFQDGMQRTHDQEVFRFASIAQLISNGARRASVPAAATKRVITRYMLKLEDLLTAQQFEGAAEELGTEICGLVRTCSNHRYSPLVCSIIDRIRTGFTEKISLSSISREFGLNESYVSNVFKRETGETIGNRILNLRLEYARTMLTVSERDISDICQHAGFSDHSYFTKRFRETYGVAPTEYRDRLSQRNKERN